MLLSLFTLAMVVGGYATIAWLWERETKAGRVLAPKSLADTATMTLLAAMAIAIAIDWALSAVRGLSTWPLMLLAAAIGVASIAWWVRRDRAPEIVAAEPARPSRERLLIVIAIALALLPLAIWIGFVLWRGYIMPPINHDALAYHLPKAVFYARHHGYYHVDAPDWRIAALPSNYEILLTDIVVLTDSDRITEWLGVACFIAYLLASVALIERWWGAGIHLLPACLVLAGMPLTLLHSGADKNDLLVAALSVFVIQWTARWAALGESISAIVAIVAAAMLVGVKPNGLILVAAVAPGVLLGASRRRALSNAGRPLLTAILLGVVALLLLGGAAYVDNLLPHTSIFPPGPQTKEPFYGQWPNLWMAPILFLLVPFSSNESAVWVPWRHEYWFWPRYELFFSHWGSVVSLLVVALPLAIFVMRRRRVAEGDTVASAFEVKAAAVGAIVAMVVLLPMNFTPLGMFAAYPRYLLFVPAAIVAATIPALCKLPASGTTARTAMVFVAILGSIGSFTKNAIEYAEHDRFQTTANVEDALAVDRARAVPFQYRASTYVDAHAGPRDLIAVDGGTGTWLQPLFGVDLTRRLVFIQAIAGHVDLPDDARWVVVDRFWSLVWSDPRFQNTGQWREFLDGDGVLPAVDTEVYRILRRDRRFVDVYDDRKFNQAVFVRVAR